MTSSAGMGAILVVLTHCCNTCHSTFEIGWPCVHPAAAALGSLPMLQFFTAGSVPENCKLRRPTPLSSAARQAAAHRCLKTCPSRRTTPHHPKVSHSKTAKLETRVLRQETEAIMRFRCFPPWPLYIIHPSVGCSFGTLGRCCTEIKVDHPNRNLLCRFRFCPLVLTDAAFLFFP